MEEVEYVSLGVGVAACLTSALAYVAYYKSQQLVNVLKDIAVVSVGEDLVELLRDVEVLPYVALTGGLVYPYVQAIVATHNSQSKGVIQVVNVTEHKSVWKDSVRQWKDTTRTISHKSHREDFYLSDKKETTKVHIREPLRATYLDLTTVYDNYEPAKSTSFGEEVINVVSGERVKGVQTVEQMLLCGTPLLGIGRLTLSGGILTLSPPIDNKYILTQHSLEEVVTLENTTASVWKGVAIFFGLAGGSCITYWLYKHVKRRRLRAEWRRLAEENMAPADQQCVVCLDEPRGVVLLECGHVCTCRMCAERLQHCPICRSQIERIIPMFAA